VAGVMQAPLTGILLVMEVTGGYEVILPLMIVSVLSLLVTRRFDRYGIYTKELAAVGDLMRLGTDRRILSEINLSEARLAGADLSGAIMTEADLNRAYLHQANLTRANLNGVDLRGAILTEADLSRAYLHQAKLNGANLRGVSYSSTTTWPDGFDPEKAGAVEEVS